MIAIGDLGVRDENGWIISIPDRIGFDRIQFPTLEIRQSAYESTRRRHDGRSNANFSDGHVEGLSFSRLFGYDDRQLKRWNNDNEAHRNLVTPATVQP
jgi:prepilin-type processing-associated H-X9-DG protein